MSKHTHRPSRAKDNESVVRPYLGPVAFPGDPRAHGNVRVIDTCCCGSRRVSNVNGRFVEYGPWEDIEKDI